MFGGEITGTEARHYASAAEIINRVDDARQQGGIPKRGIGDQGAERDLGYAHGERRHQ